MLMHRVRQDVRSLHLGILPQRTIGRTAPFTLKAQMFKAPLGEAVTRLFNVSAGLLR
jgi:hypothetical protein